MDPVLEIKARLPIEELVRQYTQLTKKGRNFVALCPFHHDKRPSLLVSPDKGIAYCFPCQKGGDIFSFYQLVENCDFAQAIRELAEKTGVKLEQGVRPVEQDEKERLRLCLEEAATFFREKLQNDPSSLEYLAKRGLAPEEIGHWEIGLAPSPGSALYDHLLKAGYSRKEIVGSGLAVQRDLKDGRAFDRFRARIMFPIRDAQGRMIGFGGRTLINDDAKYMNTSDGPLYRKSSVLYGLAAAREAMRAGKSVVVVEGYFDLIACHRVGVQNVVATCGTALTEEHARILKRYCDTVVLCLDSDRAGRAAAERAFGVLSRESVAVRLITLSDKDPADSAQEDPRLLAQLLTDGGVPYIDAVLDDIRKSDARSPVGRRDALGRLSAIHDALPTQAERQAFLAAAAPVMQLAESQLESDLRQHASVQSAPAIEALPPSSIFSAAEIALGLLLLYPQHRELLRELIPPEDGFAAEIYASLEELPTPADEPLAAMELSPEARERATILTLFCEEHGFGAWSDSMALREIRHNCMNANRETLKRKQSEITSLLLSARKNGKVAEEEMLRTQYQQLLKLAKMAM